MEIFIVSDNRLPTNPTYAGHGLGKSVLKLVQGLKDGSKGVQTKVHVYAAPNSHVPFADSLEIYNDEALVIPHIAERIAKLHGKTHKVIIDSTHQFEIAKAFFGAVPTICKVVDMEGTPVGNSVFSTKQFAVHRGYENAVVVHDFFNIPLYRGSIHNKRGGIGIVGIYHPLNDALEFARFYKGKVYIITTQTFEPSVLPNNVIIREPKTPEKLQEWLAHLRAVLAFDTPTSTASEALAVGTPVLTTNKYIEIGTEYSVKFGTDAKALADYANSMYEGQIRFSPSHIVNTLSGTELFVNYKNAWRSIVESVARGEQVGFIEKPNYNLNLNEKET